MPHKVSFEPRARESDVCCLTLKLSQGQTPGSEKVQAGRFLSALPLLMQGRGDQAMGDQFGASVTTTSQLCKVAPLPGLYTLLSLCVQWVGLDDPGGPFSSAYIRSAPPHMHVSKVITIGDQTPRPLKQPGSHPAPDEAHWGAVMMAATSPLFSNHTAPMVNGGGL